MSHCLLKRGRNRMIEERKPTNFLHEWLLARCMNDIGTFNALKEAFSKLHSKQILRNDARHHEALQKRAILIRSAAFTDFGWKLAGHLYSATDVTE